MHTRTRIFRMATVVAGAAMWAGTAVAQTSPPGGASGQAQMPQGDIPVEQAPQGAAKGDVTRTIPLDSAGDAQRIAEQPQQPAPAEQPQQAQQVAEQPEQPAQQPQQAQQEQFAEQPEQPAQQQAEREGPNPEWLAKQNRETLKLNQESLAKIRSQKPGTEPQG